MILDDKELMDSGKKVSDSILMEIANGGKSYPIYFIEKAEAELAKRNVTLIREQVLERDDLTVMSLYEWCRENKSLSMLTFLTALFSGLFGFL